MSKEFIVYLQDGRELRVRGESIDVSPDNAAIVIKHKHDGPGGPEHCTAAKFPVGAVLGVVEAGALQAPPRHPAPAAQDHAPHQAAQHQAAPAHAAGAKVEKKG